MQSGAMKLATIIFSLFILVSCVSLKDYDTKEGIYVLHTVQVYDYHFTKTGVVRAENKYLRNSDSMLVYLTPQGIAENVVDYDGGNPKQNYYYFNDSNRTGGVYFISVDETYTQEDYNYVFADSNKINGNVIQNKYYIETALQKRYESLGLHNTNTNITQPTGGAVQTGKRGGKYTISPSTGKKVYQSKKK